MPNFFMQAAPSRLQIGGIALILLLGAAIRTEAQTNPNAGEKLVEITPEHRSDAVMITKITVGDVNVQCGVIINPHEMQPVLPFQAGSDWLQNMTISVFNRTDKTIAAFYMEVVFQQTGDGRVAPRRAHPIWVGQLPKIDAFNGRTGQPLRPHPERKPIAWQPGQTFAIHLGDYIEDVQANLADLMSLTSVNQVLIRISPVFFEDGMRWESGGFSIPDGDHPGKFQYLPDNYFPGNQYHNWPPGYPK